MNDIDILFTLCTNRAKASLYFESLSGLEYHTIPYLSFFSTSAWFFTHFFKYLRNMAIWISPIVQVILFRLNFPWYFLRNSSSLCSIRLSELSCTFFTRTVTPAVLSGLPVTHPFFVLFSSFQIFPHLLQWRVCKRL